MDDTGSTVTLEGSDDGGLTWSSYATRAWAPTIVWGLIVEFSPYLWRCYETGNGSSYTGRSEDSAIVDLS